MVPRQLENENDIVKSAAAGNHRDFEKLIKHYEKYIYSIACKFADIQQDREEVVQESVLKVWQNLSKFKFNSKFSTWLFVVVANDSRRILTRRHTIPSHPYNQKVLTHSTHLEDNNNPYDSEDYWMESLVNYHNDGQNSIQNPENIHNADKLQDKIFEEAQKLSPELYEAWWMREIDLLTYQQISELTESPIGTVKSRLFNAREILNEALSDYLGDNKNRFQMEK